MAGSRRPKRTPPSAADPVVPAEGSPDDAVVPRPAQAPPPAWAAAASPGQIDAWLAQGRLQLAQQAAAALANAQRAAQAARAIDYQHGVLGALLLSARARARVTTDPAACQDELQCALALAEALGDEQAQAEACQLLGNLHAARGAHAPALDAYQRDLVLRRRVGDRRGEAGALNNIGLVHRRMAQYPEALAYLLMSLELAEGRGDLRAQAYAFTNIGAVLADMDDTTPALQYLLRGLETVRGTDDRVLESSVLCALGRLLKKTGHLQEAQARLQEALQLAQRDGRLAETGEALLGLALVQMQQGALPRAERLLLEALGLARRAGDRLAQAEVLLALGRARGQLGEDAAAIELLERALALATPLQADQLAGRVHRLLSELHERMGRFEPALRAFQAFHACQDRISGLDTQRRIRSLLSRADLERAHRDAELHRQRGDALATALDAARESEREKQALLAQLARQSDLLRQLAREDGLTGLANRRWLDAQWAQECERARRYGHPVAVAMVDIDHFKSVNDRFSHRVGDEVLRRVALMLRDSVRRGDIVGRYGGEEFVIVWVETPLAQAAAACEKLRERVAALPLHDLHPDLRGTTVSVGLAGVDRQPQDDALMAAADAQLYRAKAEGRNRVCW